METKQKTTLTQGSVARGMLLFALPIFISNLFQQLYNAADISAAQLVSILLLDRKSVV